MEKHITNCKRLFTTIKEESGMKTFSEVAQSIGVNRAALSNMMAGRRQISSDVIIRVIEAHGISLARIRALMD